MDNRHHPEAAYGEYGGVVPASGAAAAMAFSSQSVMTFAQAGTAAPTARQTPIIAAEAHGLVLWAVRADICSLHFAACRAGAASDTATAVAEDKIDEIGVEE